MATVLGQSFLRNIFLGDEEKPVEVYQEDARSAKVERRDTSVLGATGKLPEELLDVNSEITEKVNKNLAKIVSGYVETDEYQYESVEQKVEELEDQAKIHDRLDIAIEKLTDVSNSINRMLAVHEEKIARQEESLLDAEQQIELRRSEMMMKIDELHSRITTNTKEIMNAAAKQHAEQNKEIQKIQREIEHRVGVLEKWRHVLIGGSIVVGFLLHKFIDFT